MDIENLRVFCKTYSCQSISLAAKELFLTQPTITHKLKALEAELNLVLFERSNKGVIPTEAGHIVFNYAQNMLGLYGNLMQDLASFDGKQVKRLTISSCSTFGQYALPCSLFEFNKRTSNIDLQLEHAFSSEIITQVKDQGVDVGFIEGTYSDEEIECLPLGTSQLLFVTSPQLLSIESALQLDDLYDFNLILMHRKSTLRKIIESTLKKKGIDLSKLNVVESPSLESIKSALLSGQGVSVLPYMSIKKELFTKSLVSLNFDDLIMEYPFSLIHKKQIIKVCKSEFIDYIKIEGLKNLC